ncbi:glycosyltransferase [Halomonas sp. BC04]|uniref:glycosyltransferase n=1 Tax=Halomonas sp. BC04 TaxID=1403540 RepID=UPI0003ED6102|nr:glycosyltransferase [Halomonas sp. BC04]EWG99103.1 hypothetical protein Q427_26920 [Halomonas sp. BC04]
MKLVLFIGDLFPGGAERQLVHLANGLAARGHQVTLLTLLNGDAYLESLSEKVSHVSLATKRPLSALIALVRYLRREKPQLMINFLLHATLLGRVACRMTGVACLTSYRNVSYGSPLRDGLIRWSSHLDHVTSSNVAAAIGTLYPRGKRRRLEVIPNVYLNGAIAELEPLPRQGTGFHWLFLGRLEAQKNLSALLEAFRTLCESPAQATSELPHLWLAGEGPERQALEQQIERLGLARQVTLLGHLDNPARALAAADAFILPSSREGMPNALMEAMAHGLPCVATPVGAVPEMLEGERGILTVDTSSAALAEAMQQLMLSSSAERIAMAERARAYIHSACGPDAVLERWDSLIHQATASVARDPTR